MDAETNALARLATPADAARSLRAGGKDWDTAIALGVDVTLLERNLRLTPAERMRIHDLARRRRSALARSGPGAAIAGELARERLLEKLTALGYTLEDVDPERPR